MNYPNHAYLSTMSTHQRGSISIAPSVGIYHSRQVDIRFCVDQSLYQCGVVPGKVVRWHHLIIPSIEVLGHTQTESSIPLVR